MKEKEKKEPIHFPIPHREERGREKRKKRGR